jgi:hypothetical protein
MKRYRCCHRKYSLPLIVDGKPVRIAFTGGVRMGTYAHGGTFSTNDPALQQVLEVSSAFARGEIWVERILPSVPVGADEGGSASPVPPADAVEGVRNQQQAEEYLRTKGHDVPPGTLKSEEVARLAHGAGISFPDWQTYQRLYL